LELDLVVWQGVAHKEFRLTAQGPELLLSLGISVDLEARDKSDLVGIVGHYFQVVCRVIGATSTLLPFYEGTQTDEAAEEIPRLIHHLRFTLDSPGAQNAKVFSCFVGVRGFPKGFIVDQGEGDPHLIEGI